MDFHARIKKVQNSLKNLKLDGWLLYDFRRSNDLACRFLDLPSSLLLTRRLFYWIPQTGAPIKLVHRIENKSLDHLPGQTVEFARWEELNNCLSTIVKGSRKVAMEYSPQNAIPTVSKVDAGTVDLVRSFGVEVVSSADLLQIHLSEWDPEQLASHLFAADTLKTSVKKAWKFIADSIASGVSISEYDVQKFLLEEFKSNDCISDDPPICAVNGHAADPHYTIDPKQSAVIKSGDFILIDLWCKKNTPKAVYADITQVAVAAKAPTEKQKQIFDIVRNARDAAMELLISRFSRGIPVMGWEVDQVCRQKIEDAGYGVYFNHRTGHNIGERDHGDGANIDNFETKDARQLVPKTCFSIEPGIYLPGEFGVRLEHDVYIEPGTNNVLVTTDLQNEILCLL